MAKKRKKRPSFQGWGLYRHLGVKASRPPWSMWIRQLLKLNLLQCRYVSQELVSSVTALLYILLIVSPQPSKSDLHHMTEVMEGRVVSVTWQGLETPPQRESPGRLEEDPVEGPASCFTVEERFRGFRLGVGYLHHDVDKVTVWDICQEEWENAMIDAQWD